MIRRARGAFTLVELLIVVAILALLVSILLPALSGARQAARGAVCRANLRSIGQGFALYLGDNRDVLVPGRLPRLDDCNWAAQIPGGRKYRPTFLAIASHAVDVPPFADPQACGSGIDRFGERGDRQDYAAAFFICPGTSDWSDERNGSYGYNYQFLGNSRLRDPGVVDSFKNWPVRLSSIVHPGATIAAADSMGTAASFAPAQRRPYENNGRDAAALGDEGFNLDPPRVDPLRGEMASPPAHRSAADPRHRGRANALWVDGHVDDRTLAALGYRFNADESVALDGDNSLWSGSRRDQAWTPALEP